MVALPRATPLSRFVFSGDWPGASPAMRVAFATGADDWGGLSACHHNEPSGASILRGRGFHSSLLYQRWVEYPEGLSFSHRRAATCSESAYLAAVTQRSCKLVPTVNMIGGQVPSYTGRIRHELWQTVSGRFQVCSWISGPASKGLIRSASGLSSCPTPSGCCG